MSGSTRSSRIARMTKGPTSFLEFETALLGLLRSLGCLLIQLFLRSRHDRLDPAAWRARGYRVADPAAGRTLKTSCGRSPMSGPSSCRAAAVGPACTRWTSRWA